MELHSVSYVVGCGESITHIRWQNSVLGNIIGSQLAQHESTIDVVAVGVITAGGTGDLAAVFEDLLSRHPSSQWVLHGGLLPRYQLSLSLSL